ncbi:MAG TPA: Fe-S metabolism protein SufE [Verrucomicrobiales bacterium]|nr:Fe-S metabolism protein SufE [Verrucomicrobiales bacterium]
MGPGPVAGGGIPSWEEGASRGDLDDIPIALREIVLLFEILAESERRETLLSFAQSAGSFEPLEGEVFDVEDLRQDVECSDKVGVYVRAGEDQRLHLRMRLGPEAQTLTRAMAGIFCQGLEGATAAEVLAVPDAVVFRIVGARLMRLRSRTVYYVLERIREAVRSAGKRMASRGAETQ